MYDNDLVASTCGIGSNSPAPELCQRVWRRGVPLQPILVLRRRLGACANVVHLIPCECRSQERVLIVVPVRAGSRRRPQGMTLAGTVEVGQAGHLWQQALPLQDLEPVAPAPASPHPPVLVNPCLTVNPKVDRVVMVEHAQDKPEGRVIVEAAPAIHKALVALVDELEHEDAMRRFARTHKQGARAGYVQHLRGLAR